MGAGDHVVRTSVLIPWLLMVGGWGVTYGAAGPGFVAQSGPSLASGTYDAGESLQVGSRQIPLLRSRQKVAVIQAPTAGIAIAAVPDEIETTGRLYRAERHISPSGAAGPGGRPATTVFQTRQFTSLADQTSSLRQLQRQTGASEVVPVYIHGDSGLEMIPTGKIVVKLKVPGNLAGLSALNRRLGTQIDHRIRGTTDLYVLAAPHATARELFALCAVLEAEPALEWAEPDFLLQVVRESLPPNDPLFDPNQWYLPQINAPQAWEIVTGSSQVIIAIIDDGMDLRHEDLRDALPSNAAEVPDNGLDDDHNGWTDDADGWNFHDDDNNPNPGYPFGGHGTEVAGVAAATGNNGIGIAGCAWGCKLMPLKVFGGDLREETEDIINEAIAESLFYAAGRTQNGQDRWRGADVISISLRYSETNLGDTALQFAAEQGRGGQGCPIFCASGNDGSGWSQYRIDGINAGTHHFRWEVARDASGSAGADTVWLDSIVWPGGTPEVLTESLPAGSTTGGDANWILVQNDAAGNHAMTGWYGSSGWSLRPGPLEDWGRSFLDVRKSVGDGHLDFWVWTSLEDSSPSLVGGSFFIIEDPWPFSTHLVPQNRRTQFICLRDELGWNPYTPPPVRNLKFVEFQMVDAPTRRVDELTIRIKSIEAGRDRYYSAQWDESGWTTVFHGTDVPLNTGSLFDLPGGGRANLIRFNFMKDFPYNPRDNLAVDVSMTQSLWGTQGGRCLTSLTDETRTIVGAESGTLGPDRPADWRGSYGQAQLTNWIPMMWIGSGDELRLFVDGILVAKASGIAHSEAGIAYPASDPLTVAVGASTDFGLRSDYSQFGPNLDFVAPSSGGARGIYTTDRTGSYGDDPGDYTGNFGGTSAATPLVSGVAALMLSRNPNLTPAQIRTILRQTCQKVGDQPYTDGRNDQYGFGRIDAEAAVLAAGTGP